MILGRLHRGAAALLLAFAFASAVTAQDASPPPATSVPTAAPPPPRASVTRHKLTLDGRELAYTATVGSLGLADTSSTVKAQITYTAYVADGGDARRPLTIAFNGGPGASSAWLHMGGLGPRRLVVPDDGGAPTPPIALADNAETWLAFTDLVFFDPVGTGFSVPAQVDGKPVPTREFWGVAEDVDWAARFVRQYLNRNNRWGSPLFLAGESYGGFRAGRLSQRLQEDFAVPLTGIVMISPFLERELTFTDGRLFPLGQAVLLPSYAAVAWHHGRLPAVGRGEAARDAFLGEVEFFALTDFLATMSLGRRASEAQRDGVYQRLAEVTGMPLDALRRSDGRIRREIFIKEGIPGRVLGRYDASVTLADSDPHAPRTDDPDPSAVPFAAALAAATNMQLRETLKVDRIPSYVVMNGNANREWNWRGGQGSVGQLRQGMIANPALKVLIVHGRFDLVTPYFSSTYVAQQISLPPEQRANLELALLDGGHMMYFHAAERVRLTRLAAEFYARALPARP